MWALTSTDHLPVGTNMHMSGVTLSFEHQGLIMSNTKLVHSKFSFNHGLSLGDASSKVENAS